MRIPREDFDELILAIRGDPPIGAAGDFAYLGIVRAQANLAADDHIEWDTSSIVGGSLSVSTGAGQLAGIITMEAGHIYRIGVGLSLGFDSNLGTLEVHLYNRTLSAKLIPDGGAIDPTMTFKAPASTSSECQMPVLWTYFTPTVVTDIEVRLETAGGGAALDFINPSCWMTIQALT